MLSLLGIALASCGTAPVGDNPAKRTRVETVASGEAPFAITAHGNFRYPWAMAFAPGTDVLFITERGGKLKALKPGGSIVPVGGVPQVDFGGQGGFGDIAFLESERSNVLTSRTIYLSWAEAGDGDTRGAVVGRGRLVCEGQVSCDIRDLSVIWRQAPKVSGRGHYSHRIAISPDGKYLFVGSGDRQKMEPAQDNSNNLGTIVRLNLDGSPAAGNPFAGGSGVSSQVWSYGHRNILGLEFSSDGRLWDIEHGPLGGDELNLVEPGRNYGWPVVSNGTHYDGTPIPDHATRPDLAAPALSWSPVIAPAGMIFYRGRLFPAWQGKALIAAMKPAGVVAVEITGNKVREIARIPMDRRIRAIEQDDDGAIWLLEDGVDARLLSLSPLRR